MADNNQHKNWLGGADLEYERIHTTLTAYEQELRANAGLQKDEHLKSIISNLVNQAKAATEQKKYDQAWKYFHSAKRLEVNSFSANELYSEVVRIKHEATKASQWRRKAVEQLLPWQEDALFTAENLPKIRENISKSLLLLNDNSDNVYLRLQHRKRQITIVATLLGLSVLTYLILNYLGQMWLHVPLLGMIGALFSTAVTLTSSSVNDKIPDQMLGAQLIFLRPFIGAASAIVAHLLLQSGIVQVLDNRQEVIYVVSFAAGFSERYIINALESIVKPGKTSA